MATPSHERFVGRDTPVARLSIVDTVRTVAAATVGIAA
jgi:hypothetical protein